MKYEKRAQIYVSASMLAEALGLKDGISITDIEKNKERNCYRVYVTGESLPEVMEGMPCLWIDASDIQKDKVDE